MTSLRVMEFELHGTCWKPLLKASQEVRRDSTTGDHIWGRTSPGERVSSSNCMSNNTLPTGIDASTHTHTHTRREVHSSHEPPRGRRWRCWGRGCRRRSRGRHTSSHRNLDKFEVEGLQQRAILWFMLWLFLMADWTDPVATKSLLSTIVYPLVAPLLKQPIKMGTPNSTSSVRVSRSRHGNPRRELSRLGNTAGSFTMKPS